MSHALRELERPTETERATLTIWIDQGRTRASFRRPAAARLIVTNPVRCGAGLRGYALDRRVTIGVPQEWFGRNSLFVNAFRNTSRSLSRAVTRSVGA